MAKKKTDDGEYFVIDNGDSPESFEIKFNYPTHEIPAQVLSEYLGNLDLLIKDISSYHGATHEIVVKASKEGSFEIEALLQIVSGIGLTKSLLDKDIIKNVIASLGDLFKFFIQSKQLDKDVIKTEEGDTFIIKDNKDTTVTVNKNTYNFIVDNPKSKTRVAKMHRATQNEKTLKSVKIRYANQEILDISQEEAQILATIDSQKLDFNDDKHIHKNKQDIKLRRYDFDSRHGWRMLFEGRQQEVSLEEPVMEDLEKKRINDKDTFIVDITIVQKFSEKFNSYIDHNYIINYLHQHIPFEENNLPYKE